MTTRLRFKGIPFGIKVPESKLTEDSPIETAPLPQKVIIPLQQNIGAPCQALVKKGDRVLTGQKIGDSDKLVSAPVHATVSGEVTGTTTVVNPPTGALVEALVIESDGEDRWVKLTPAPNPAALSAREILGRIREAGLVGLGGAAFPTHVKLSPPKGKVIDSVILNGCECEPFVTGDHRVMLEYGQKVLSGLAIIKKLLAPKEVYIAIEDNKKDAIRYLAELIKKLGYDFTLVTLKSKYPMGAEKILTQLILGREVPLGGLPMDVGAVIQNVSTAKAIHEAVIEGRPLIERVVTVTGLVKHPRNLLARIGTPIGDLINHCGGLTHKADKIVLGGPMMGVSQFDLDFPLVKGTNNLLAMKGLAIRELTCISCGRCIDVCPVRVMPTLLAKHARAGNYTECKDVYYIDDCFECGACSYVCPSNIPLTQYIKVAKKEIAKRVVGK